MADRKLNDVLEAEIAHEDAITEAVYQFNRNPRVGIQKLIATCGASVSPPSIAHLMHTAPGLDGTKIAEYLSKTENLSILHCYYNEMNLKGDFLPAMRRSMLGTMFITGESDAINRLIDGFCDVYVEQNPDTLFSAENAKIIAYAIVMLNTDLHKTSTSRKMSLIQFIRNTRNALPTEVISDSDLERYYNDIKENQLLLSGDNQAILPLCAPSISGKLRKRQDKWNSYWTQHIFVLLNSCLYYYKTIDDAANNNKPLGMIIIMDVNIDYLNKSKNQLVIETTGQELTYVKYRDRPLVQKGVRRFLLEIESEHECEKWLYRLRKSVCISNFNNTSQVRVTAPAGTGIKDWNQFYMFL